MLVCWFFVGIPPPRPAAVSFSPEDSGEARGRMSSTQLKEKLPEERLRPSEKNKGALHFDL